MVLLQPGTEPHVPVDRTGRVQVPAYAGALAAGGVAAAVLQSANGEVGTRQPVDEVDDLCRAGGVPLLLDLTASLGRDGAHGAPVTDRRLGARCRRGILRRPTDRTARRAHGHSLEPARPTP